MPTAPSKYPQYRFETATKERYPLITVGLPSGATVEVSIVPANATGDGPAQPDGSGCGAVK